MTNVTRKIGLSLGADECWPICFEDIVSDLAPKVRVGTDTVDFEIKRVTIEPFKLGQPQKYDVVVDRLTHWYHPSREWIKQSILMNDLYVFNNPWSVQSMEKQTTYCAMMQLGMPIPETWLIPPKEYDETPDLETTLTRYAELFDLKDIGKDLGYPLFMKPYDGGGWVGVSKIDDGDALNEAYDDSGKFVMHLQQGVHPYEEFVRCVGIGPQVRKISYDPTAPLHQRYETKRDFLSKRDERVLEDVTLTINSFFGWDFNSCESLLKNGVWHPIDFANPCPDSQVTSLHRHFPWLVKAKIRWALFCAATNRKMRANLDWQPYFDLLEEDMTYEERLVEYGKIARARFEEERFEEFCEKQLAGLDEVAFEYFGDDRAKQAIRGKVQALFPEHEWEDFTEHFWEEVQVWRETEGSK